jgi:hypothetical protein
MQPNQVLSVAAQQLAPTSARKSLARTHHRPHERVQLIKFLEALVEADLTQGGYRVMLDTLARLLRQGRASESVTTDWMAIRLGIGRNTVGTAYCALERAGFLKRVAVKHRGAPTRTRLIGITAALIDGVNPGDVPALTNQFTEEGRDLAQAPEQEQSMPDATDPSEQLPAAPSLSCAQDELNGQLPAETTPEPAQNEPASVLEINGEGAAANANALIAKKPLFIFDPAVNASMIVKVPAEARMSAMQSRSVDACPIDAAWGLTDAETRYYLALIPKPEPPTRKSAAKPAAPRETMPQDAELMRALAYAHRRLTDIAGSAEAAAKLGDQIAFQVYRGLGGGDVLGGVRAGISLVAKGRWTEPREYNWFRAKWSGITARAVVMAALA